MTFEEWWEQIEAYGLGLPEGYVLVPVEPTKKMLKAGWKQMAQDCTGIPEEIYEAMIQASQEGE